MLKQLLIRLEGLLRDRDAEIRDLNQRVEHIEALANEICDEYGIRTKQELFDALSYWASHHK